MQDAHLTPGRPGRPRGDAAGLERAISREPTSFAFYQAVRLLQRLHPERSKLGSWSDPASEVVRIRASTSLGFPASEIQELTYPDDGATDRALMEMVVNFFGLTGPQSVLPHLYSEHAATRARARDTAFRDFLDMFNHRALSLLYRAWEKGQVAVAHESGIDDRPMDRLLDLAGLGTEGLRGRLPFRDEVVAYFSGLLATRARSADGLARIVSDYFEVPATVEQFVGDWRRVDAGGQCTLSAEDASGQLGFGVLGDAGWDPQSRVRLRLGPLTRAQFDAFVPGGSAYEPLRALTQLYADDMVGVDAQLVLSRAEVSPCVLEVPDPARGRTARGPGLGRGTWLASRPLSRDPDETTLRLC